MSTTQRFCIDSFAHEGQWVSNHTDGSGRWWCWTCRAFMQVAKDSAAPSLESQPVAPGVENKESHES